MRDDFNGTVLNPDGNKIFLPYWVFKRLKSLRLLERDRASGMRRITGNIFGLMDLWDGPDFRPDRKFSVINPGMINSPCKDSGYASAFLKALGRDCSGLNVSQDKDLESELDHTRLPGPDQLEQDEASRIVREVKARRHGQHSI